MGKGLKFYESKGFLLKRRCMSGAQKIEAEG